MKEPRTTLDIVRGLLEIIIKKHEWVENYNHRRHRE